MENQKLTHVKGNTYTDGVNYWHWNYIVEMWFKGKEVEK